MVLPTFYFHIFLQLEKVLQQGDISEVAEPYMKDEKGNTE